jgi:hypothetical protein
MNNLGIFTSVGAGGAFVLALIAAWCTHLVWIIIALSSDVGATAGQIVLGGFGVFMPPVGVLHGVMIWMGVGA